MDITARVRSPEGLDMEIAIRNIVWEGAPAGVAVRAKAIEKALVAEGFKAMPAPVAAAAPAAGAGADGGTGILNVNSDGTRACSIHGPAKFVPGKEGSGKPGNWYCTNFQCKAREARSG